MNSVFSIEDVALQSLPASDEGQIVESKQDYLARLDSFLTKNQAFDISLKLMTWLIIPLLGRQFGIFIAKNAL